MIIEVENRLANKNWSHAGVYNEEGTFLIRKGEHICIQKHFRKLRANRKSVESLQTVNSESSFNPSIKEK